MIETKIKIDDEIKKRLEPLSATEITNLRASIAAEGCRDPLILWNDTLIDGHNRYAICTELDIPFTTVSMNFDSRDEALRWIDINQLSRRNLTDEQRDILYGRISRITKTIGFKGNQYASKSASSRADMADALKISEKTLQRAERYLDAIEVIETNVGSETINKILAADLKISKQDIINIGKLDNEKQKMVIEKIEKGEVNNLKGIYYIEAGGSLRDKYSEPPFSVLDGRSTNWNTRKAFFKSLGLKSEEGRSASKSIPQYGETYFMSAVSETSIFDPVLCEVLYKWFCTDGGSILDPFAGGSVRGIMAHYFGYKYTGIDIREEQVVANIQQGKDILPADNQPTWITGDSRVALADIEDESYDLIFTCPPYLDLEVYSDLDGDISNMEYDEFIEVYEDIISKSVKKLKKGGYAVFVVGDVRGKDGYYLDFVGTTKKAFINAGTGLYNEAIYLQNIGTAVLRAGRFFEKSRKITKLHENVLIFKKK